MPCENSLDILVLDDEPNIRKTLAIYLKTKGHRVRTVAAPEEALRALEASPYDVAFVDIRLGTVSGLDVIPRMRALLPRLRITVITAFASIETAVEAIRRGASEYLPKPFTPAQIDVVLQKIMDVQDLERKAEGHPRFSEDAQEIEATVSPAMQTAVALGKRVADSDATVLLLGENGTGKGMFARAIHRWSRREAKPFTVVACPSLSPDLLESELFGSVKGAFTGALRDNPGKIGITNGGTLFLDEVGELPLSLQPKLLRFLQDREYERLGEPHSRRADVRIMAATNQDLKKKVAGNQFREDLFYRLNVVEITLPPLRDRVQDVLPLAERFRAQFSVRYRRPAAGFTEAALAALQAYLYPGNVRELRNLVERAVILCNRPVIDACDLPFTPRDERNLRVGGRVTLAELEEAHIRQVVAATPSLEEAARVLGIDPATLWRRRRKYEA